MPCVPVRKRSRISATCAGVSLRPGDDASQLAITVCARVRYRMDSHGSARRSNSTALRPEIPQYHNGLVPRAPSCWAYGPATLLPNSSAIRSRGSRSVSVNFKDTRYLSLYPAFLVTAPPMQPSAHSHAANQAMSTSDVEAIDSWI